MAPTSAINESTKLEKPPIKFSNLLVGSALNMFEVSTLGQPLEVMKTTMAANRADGFAGAVSRIWSRGGVFGCESATLSLFSNLPSFLVRPASNRSR
jgi:hypothetical protein